MRGALFGLTALVVTGCQSSSTSTLGSLDIPSMSELLIGYQCYAAPSGFNKVGRIFELREDGAVIQRGEIADTSVIETRGFALGAINVGNRLNLGATIELLENAIPDLSARISGSLNRSRMVHVQIVDAVKQVGNTDVSPQAIEWARQNQNLFRSGGSRMFYVQEAILASQMKYVYDRRTYGQLFGNVSLSGITGINAPEQDAGEVRPGYELDQTFSEPLGVCVMVEEIVLDTSGGGGFRAELVPIREEVLTVRSVR